MPIPIAARGRRASLWRGVLGVSLATAIGLTAANVADWLSFRSSLQVTARVSADEWAAMFAKARELAQGKLLRLKGGELPAEFARLGVSDADFFQNRAQLRMYKRGELAVYLDFDLNREWERITLSVSGTPQRLATIWSADPVSIAQLEPKGRTLTVTMSSYRGTHREWIVLPSEIRLVEQDFAKPTYSVATFPLSRHHTEKIGAAVAAIPSGFRGRLHTAGGSHGIILRVGFRADG